MPVDALPEELLTACLAVLSVQPLTRAGQASRRWRVVAGSDALWRPLLVARWPELASLQHVESLKALYRSKVLLLQTQPPSIESFQFIVVLSSVRLGVLLRKVVVGNDKLSWAISSDDFLLTPGCNWSCGCPSFYDEGVCVVDLIESNDFELSVQVFYNGKLAEIIPSAGIKDWDEEDQIQAGTVRFDGSEAVCSEATWDHTLIYGAELVEQQLDNGNTHWMAAGGCGRWVRDADEDEANGIDTCRMLRVSYAHDFPPEGFDPWEGFVWPPMELRVGTRFIDLMVTSLQGRGFTKVLAGMRWA